MPEIASILDSTKDALGVQQSVTAFDSQIIMHINGTLANITQLGVGPENGFRISDNTKTWADLLGNNEERYAAAKDYMFLSVRILFDPPSLMSVLTAFKELREEAAWRLNRAREDLVHPIVPKEGVPLPTDGSDLDGSATMLSVTPGLPFSKNVRITGGKNVWPLLVDVEAEMAIRSTKDPTSAVKLDFAPYLSMDYDGDDLVVSWSLTGEQTKVIPSGYYELKVSDAGPTDARAIRVLYGFVNTGL